MTHTSRNLPPLRNLVFAGFAAVLAALFLTGPVTAQTATAGSSAGSTGGTASTEPSLIEKRLVSAAGWSRTRRAGQELIAIRKFYEGRSWQPAWTAGDGAKARQILTALDGATAHGLEPRDYDAGDIAGRLAAATTDTEKADVDILLSRAIIRYGGDLAAGRITPRAINRELDINPQRPDGTYLLQNADAATDVAAYIERLAPTGKRYKRLMEALVQYREIRDTAAWKTIIPKGRKLRPGKADKRVPALRTRLVELGDLDKKFADHGTGTQTASTAAGTAGAAKPNPNLHTPELVEALKKFQHRHGLLADGVLGKRTVAALNTGADHRVEEIKINLERRRWMSRNLGQKYVFVNMADFQLKVVKNGKTVHVTRVVVGTRFHRTPVFSAEIAYAVLNPYWHVTQSIASKELLPQIKKDPEYLKRNGYKVFTGWGNDASVVDPNTVDWSQVTQEGFPYKIRQNSGRGNALGRIKFMFPNRHSVYMHDTPSKSLFARSVRSFSHGCIRIQNPLKLAEVLWAEEPGNWTVQKFQERIATGKRGFLKLQNKIPVHLTYLTAWRNKDGSTHFRNDIYGRDRILSRALAASHKKLPRKKATKSKKKKS